MEDEFTSVYLVMLDSEDESCTVSQIGSNTTITCDDGTNATIQEFDESILDGYVSDDLNIELNLAERNLTVEWTYNNNEVFTSSEAVELPSTNVEASFITNESLLTLEVLADGEFSDLATVDISNMVSASTTVTTCFKMQ